MYCPDKLKLNKFKEVNIPSNRDYFARFGKVTVPSSMYGGDKQAVPMPMNKTDELAKAQVLVDMEMEAYRNNKEGND